MQKHQRNIRFVIGLLIMVLGVGCTSSTTEPTPTAEAVVIVITAEPIVITAEPIVVVVTATPELPGPTSTPSPVPTRTRAADDGNFPVASYTPTPSPTATATPTPTATDTPPYTATPTPTSTPTTTPTPRYIPRNADWTPVERDFDGTTMVQVPPGCFDMGENRQGGRQCFDEPFWIGKYGVTNTEYAAFINAGGYSNPEYWTEAGWDWRLHRNINQPGAWRYANFDRDNQPVVGVSWYEATAYATWLGVVLCTEAQWEYAARGPDNLFYPWGNSFLADNAVFINNSSRRPSAVGSRPHGTSWVGALDMSGNAWEWVLSSGLEYPYRPNDGREEMDGDTIRVLRGGSWNTTSRSLRTVFRFSTQPFSRMSDRGFRICAPNTFEIESGTGG